MGNFSSQNKTLTTIIKYVVFKDISRQVDQTCRYYAAAIHVKNLKYKIRGKFRIKIWSKSLKILKQISSLYVDCNNDNLFVNLRSKYLFKTYEIITIQIPFTRISYCS